MFSRKVRETDVLGFKISGPYIKPTVDKDGNPQGDVPNGTGWCWWCYTINSDPNISGENMAGQEIGVDLPESVKIIEDDSLKGTPAPPGKAIPKKAVPKGKQIIGRAVKGGNPPTHEETLCFIAPCKQNEQKIDISFHMTGTGSPSWGKDVVTEPCRGPVAASIRSTLDMPTSVSVNRASYVLGDELVVTVNDVYANSNPNEIDFVSIVIKNERGLIVTIASIPETGVNTGIFESKFKLTSESVEGDGFLFVRPGAMYIVEYEVLFTDFAMRES